MNDTRSAFVRHDLAHDPARPASRPLQLRLAQVQSGDYRVEIASAAGEAAHGRFEIPFSETEL
jgi:hypothetical protein